MFSPLHRLFVPLLVLAALSGFLPAQTPPVVKITAISPEPADRLKAGQSLSIRIAYESDQPLRFRARGYFQGTLHEREGFNPSPAYPAGKGEAIAWLFAQAGARIDEVRVQVSDAKWTKIAEVLASVQAEWHAGLPAAPDAPWVKELNDATARHYEQNRRDAPPPGVRENIMTGLSMVLVPLAFFSVPSYPVLQLIALIMLRGPMRLLSALPLSFMLPIYAYCLYALSQDSNLWPLFAIFASPAAFIITLVIFIIGLRRQKRAQAA